MSAAQAGVLPGALKSVLRGATLTRHEAQAVMEEVLTGNPSLESLAALLGALRVRKETRDELAGFAEALLSHSRRLPGPPRALLDTCGTGGDGSGTFNIPTAAAFVLAGGGARVAKHGNRAVSGRCGSADVLSALAVKCDHEPARVSELIDQQGLGFLFAPLFHPALVRLAPFRRAIGAPTAFNLLGPMVNPARVRYQVMGVFDDALLVPIAEVLGELGVAHAMVVAAECGLDEFSLSSLSRYAHLHEGKITLCELSPEDVGLARASREELRGGSDGASSAAILEAVLKGEKGPRRDAVLLNAAAGFVVCGKAQDFRAGVELAAAAIDEGRALGVLSAMRAEAGM